MISVLNRLLRLNGNSRYLIFLVALSACSPKIAPVKKTETPKPVPVVEKPAPRSRKFAVANMTLLLPFQLKQNGEPDKADVERAEMAIEFYQGFKLGMDSAAIGGQNFKLNVIDSKGGSQRLGPILRQDEVKEANLVIGPVFPESIKQLGDINDSHYFVSPLAATMPEEFNNPRLISLVPNIRLHANRIANYIKSRYNAANTIVVLINPKNPESEQMGAHIRAAFQSYAKVIFQEYPTIEALETKFQKGKQYVIVITSEDKKFVSPALDKLSKIRKRLSFPIDVYGHPNWSKQNYNTEQLQALNTTISASYRVNYKRAAVIGFVAKYRKEYHFEPSEYAFKGFDAGYYFASLMARYGEDYMLHLTKEKLNGLQSGYSFYKDDRLGYINNSLMLLKYKNFTWGLVE